VWRAAARLGIPVQAATPAVGAGLAEFGTRVRFRHPLARSTAYRSAPTQQLKDLHAALADATDPAADPDRRAWHRAQAAPGPDEDIAVELERSASRAQGRGGLAAAAAFLERAAVLTPDPARRAQRLLAAARGNLEAGELEAALDLLVATEAGPVDPWQSAQVQRLRGQIAADQGRGSDAARLLLAAARRIEPFDPDLAPPQSPPGTWARPAECGRRPRPRAPRRPAPHRRGRPTSCSTRLACGEQRGTRRPRRP
jgi:Spy/CpxP family protein refolding chaperone